MRACILTNSADSFNRPMAEGLARMFRRINVDSIVLYDGLSMIRHHLRLGPDPLRKAATVLRGRQYWPSYAKAAVCDFIVVVEHLPAAYMRDLGVESLRAVFPRKPVLLYDLVALPTLRNVAAWLRDGHPPLGIDTGGHYNLDRYDWHLCVSARHELPLPPHAPVTEIGIDMEDGSLRPLQEGRFRALVDFAVPGAECARLREVVIEALDRTRTPYSLLEGRYPMAEIRRRYGQAALFFLMRWESFGLPVLEAQCCGSYVLTPSPTWVPAHRMPGGGLPPGIKAYEPRVEHLCALIEDLRDKWDADTVRKRFIKAQPHFHTGEPAALQRVVTDLRDCRIHARSHLEHR